MNQADPKENHLVSIGKRSIDQVDLLSESDMNTLATLIPELRQGIETRTLWRTPTEALYSVLNDFHFPTTESKYHQAKLEQSVFFDQLVLLSFQYRRKLLELEEIKEKMQKVDERALRRLQIDLDQINYELYVMRIEGKERVRELKMWKEIKDGLLAQNAGMDIDSKDTAQLRALALRYCRELPSALKSKSAGESVNIIAQCVTLLRACEERHIDLGRDGFDARKMLQRV